MLRRIIVILLSGVICLLGTTAAIGGKYAKQYELKEYRELVGKELKFEEAPMLRTKVAAGELPPIEQRLPEEPLVIEPVEEIGQYGGTMHVSNFACPNLDDAIHAVGYETFFRIEPDGATLSPNIAKDWELSEDGKSLILYLRKGMKWSDGMPFTADDIMFWYEDILLNKEITPVTPKVFCPGGEVMKMEKIDDFTVKLNFSAPYPLVVKILAHAKGMLFTRYPKHYLKEFHTKYNPKANELAEKEGFEVWYRLFSIKSEGHNSIPMNPDLPTLAPFKLKKRETDLFIWERNPYFWQVDTEGNQLPYIDGVILTPVGNAEMLNAKIVTGEVDFAVQHTAVVDYPLYMENAEKGDYRVLLYKTLAPAEVYYQPNQTSKDPILRKIFQDVRFRQALSLAINRDEINETIYFGKAIPRQMTVLPSCSYFEPEFAKAYAQYDPEEANRLLDEMGLEWDKNHEYRLRPDGKRLSWTFEWVERATPRGATSEIVKEYWKKIGIDMRLKEISGELAKERMPANEVDMTCWSSSGGTDIMFLQWQWYAPVIVGWERSTWTAWARWYLTNGEKGEKPPAKIKKLIEMYEEMCITTDKQREIQLGKELCREQAENVWAIGTVGMAPVPIIVKNNLRNVPEEGFWGYDLLQYYAYHSEQFFFKQR